MVLEAVVESIAHPLIGRGSQMAVAIDEKHNLREVEFLGKQMQERYSGNSATAAEQLDCQQQLRLELVHNVDPIPLTGDLDSGLVDGDPRRCRCR